MAMVLLLAALRPGPADGHRGGTNGYATVTAGAQGVRYSLTLWPAGLPPEAAERIARARAGDSAARAWLLGLIRDTVSLSVAGRRCVPGPGTLTAAAAPAETVTLAVEFTCGGGTGELWIRDDVFDVLGPDHHTLARIEAGDTTVQFAFGVDARETRVRAGRSGLLSFVRLGVEHILAGWDHLLFLLVLLLRGGGWLALAKIVTAFTVAHSVTLGLAALDVVALPDRLVEAVIALSIAAVAAENLVATPVVGRRWLVSFCFGLVHGFGFSSALREAGRPGTGLVVALLGFNVGVELGQALVVTVALPVLALLRRSRWERRMVWSSSLAILLAGVVLFVERALL
jgi:hypothetical protein